MGSSQPSTWSVALPAPSLTQASMCYWCSQTQHRSGPYTYNKVPWSSQEITSHPYQAHPIQGFACTSMLLWPRLICFLSHPILPHTHVGCGLAQLALTPDPSHTYDNRCCCLVQPGPRQELTLIPTIWSCSLADKCYFPSF